MRKKAFIPSLFLLGSIVLLVWYFLGKSSLKSDFSYLQDVQPILATKCYACHGPDEAKREAGLRLDVREAFFETLESGKTAIAADRLSDSQLIKRITSEDPDFMMPPPDFPKSLKPEEVAILQKWVETGLLWENHWSFEPIQREEPPKVRKKAWSQNPIDRFVYDSHRKQGLRPSPVADKRTLIRRLTYDLHGLPPSPEAVSAFLTDASPEAYEKLVDQLLASPRYGERWARHWLDVVHYGETHGYDKDKRRPNAWPYRDYVIDALNNDLPYNRFVEDQIAGDVLYPGEPQSVVALGFLAAGPWDLVGHVELREGTKDKRIVRNLDRDDMVTNVMASFTGLTVQCARCHDHKFDPIRQKDYYSLQAIFAGVDRAERIFDKDPSQHQKRLQLIGERKRLAENLDTLAQRMGPHERGQLNENLKLQTAAQRKIDQLKTPAGKSVGYHSIIEQQADVVKWVQVDLGEDYFLDQLVLVPAYPREGLIMPGYGFPLRFKIELSSTPDFIVADTLVDYSQEDHHERTDQPYVVELTHKKGRYIRLTASKLWKGRAQEHFLALAELQAFSNGKNVARNKKVRALDDLSDKYWRSSFLTDGYDSRNLIRGEMLPKAAEQALYQAEIQLKSLQARENEIRRSVLQEVEKEEIDRIRAFLDSIEDSLNTLPVPSLVYAAATDFKGLYQFNPIDSIRPIHLLHRGDTEQPLAQVAPASVPCLDGLVSDFDLPIGHTEGERRAALAHWLTDKQNAFTWRSIVNRVWQYHFGLGLVATPNDFGKMGTPPTHPELLDYLAAEFLSHGQSLKWLHRLIVTSRTYRQQSLQNKRNQEIDSENLFLWRANRRQLEAEAVRDAVLAVSGKLDLSMGGPGFDAFRYEDDHSPRYLYKDYDPFDPASFRRAIYRFIVRSMPDPFMSTLDCADPSQSVPVRNETITALQALSTLNNPFMVRQAAFFAERLEAAASDLPSQLQHAFELALQRPPTSTELLELEAYAEQHGLAASCRLIFAMNEFLYID